MTNANYTTTAAPQLKISCHADLQISGAPDNSVLIDIDDNSPASRIERQDDVILVTAVRDCNITCPVGSTLVIEHASGDLRELQVKGALDVNVDASELTSGFYGAVRARPVNSPGVWRREERDLAATVRAWIVIVTMTVLFGTAALLTSWLPPRGRIFLFWARGWSRALLALCGIPYRVEASEEAARVPQAVFMSNHESLVDIPLLFVGIGQSVRFLAKRSLCFVPFLGWSMWLAGFVPVDRRRTEKAPEVFQTREKRV